MTDEELEALLEELEAALRADVQEALSDTSSDFADALGEATELVAARFSVSGIRAMWRRRVNGIMSRLRSIAGRAAEVAAGDVDVSLPRNWDDNLADYTAATRALLDAVGDRLAAEATQSLAEGLNAGEDLDQLKQRLSAVFAQEGTQLGEGRAQRIAMTEATRAFNAGTLAAAQAMTGPDRPLVKQWITRHDARVRDAHRDTNGQLQLLDDPFDVDGTPMLYPGDPSAPAALTVNCRCIMRTAVAERNRGMNDTGGQSVTASAAGSQDFQSRMPPNLKRYWLTGPGAAKVRWGTPGSFDRCVRALRGDFPQDPEGLCANLYHEATGKWPGQNSNAGAVHSGAMVALMPTRQDAERLALDGGEAASELHLTLYYLGEAVDWSPEQRGQLVERVSTAARFMSPISAHVFGSAQWNPASDEPAWVWNVGDDLDAESSRLSDVRHEVAYGLEDRHHSPELPRQHSPWAPHICAMYSRDDHSAALTSRTGPVTFDRIRVAFAGGYTDIPLSAMQLEGHPTVLPGEPKPMPLPTPMYQVGDRIDVDNPHEPGQDSGTVEEVNPGPAYGILFDGTDMIHRWYVADELSPEEGGPTHDPQSMAARKLLTWSTPDDTALAFENQQTGDGRVFSPGALYWSDGPWPLQYVDEMNSGHDGARLAGAIFDMNRDASRITGGGVLYLNQQAGVEAAMLLSQAAPLGVSVDLDDVDVEMVDATGNGPQIGAQDVYRARLVTASLLPLTDGGWRLTGRTAATWTASGISTVGESTLVDIVVGADGAVPSNAFEVTAAAGDGIPDEAVTVDRQESGQYLMKITKARVRGATLVPIPAYANARIVLDDMSMFACSEAITADAVSNDYDRVVRHVRKSLLPVTASDAASFLRLPITAVRRHLARATQRGHIVRIARGTYVKPVYATPVAATAADGYALTASATGSVDLPVAGRDAAWDGNAAASRVFQWANGDVSKLDRAFAYRDDDADPKTKASRKLGFADVVGGTLTIIPRGVFAAQAALEGARGGVDIPADQMDAVKNKLDAIRAHVDEETGGGQRTSMEASAWSAMRDLPPMPRAWFSAPTDDELPFGGPGVNYRDGRIFGWVAQAGEAHAGFAKKVTIDGLGRIDTTHFLRQRFTLDDGSTIKAGAFTMNVGHHRDGAECETSACQFDDTRTVAGIVTVGMSDRGMWFSGAAAPWMSEWDRSVFLATQPSYHMKKSASGSWQLRAVLAVPVPGHSSPLMAAAVTQRSQLALTAAATMAEVEDAVVAATTGVAATTTGVADIDYDRLANSLVAAMSRAEQKRLDEVTELEALRAEGEEMGVDPA